MSTRRALPGLLLAVALIGGACASAPAPPDGAKRAPSPTPSASAASQIAGGGSARASFATPSPTPATRGTGSASPAPATGGVRIEIVIADCLEQGRPATATIRTAPGSMIVASATYSDGQSYYNYWVGTADPAGEYPVAWTPPPEAPLGDGKFLVGVQSDSGGNTAEKRFRLARAGKCP